MANSTLINLPAATTLTGTELLYGTQSNADVKITTSQIGSIIGTTPITGGATTQVLFNSSGKIASDSGLTYSGGGTTAILSIGNTIQFTGTNPGLIKSVAGGSVNYWGTNHYFNTAAGVVCVGINTVSNGVVALVDNTGSNFGRLCLGGSTASFPAIKRSTTLLQGRLGDDTAFCGIQGKLTTDTNATTGLVAGALAGTTNASIVVYDASGQAYRIPCII